MVKNSLLFTFQYFNENCFPIISQNAPSSASDMRANKKKFLSCGFLSVVVLNRSDLIIQYSPRSQFMKSGFTDWIHFSSFCIHTDDNYTWKQFYPWFNWYQVVCSMIFSLNIPARHYNAIFRVHVNPLTNFI